MAVNFQDQNVLCNIHLISRSPLDNQKAQTTHNFKPYLEIYEDLFFMKHCLEFILLGEEITQSGKIGIEHRNIIDR